MTLLTPVMCAMSDPVATMHMSKNHKLMHMIQSSFNLLPHHLLSSLFYSMWHLAAKAKPNAFGLFMLNFSKSFSMQRD